jgi:hypothetical protein
VIGGSRIPLRRHRSLPAVRTAARRRCRHALAQATLRGALHARLGRQWYGAYFDVGSARLAGELLPIDLIAQAWAVLSSAAERVRGARQAAAPSRRR